MIFNVEYETCDWLSTRHAWGCLGLLGRLICERDCAGSTWVVVVVRPSFSCALRLPSLWLVSLIVKVTETRMSKITLDVQLNLKKFSLSH
jgi:hypothetical protein